MEKLALFFIVLGLVVTAVSIAGALWFRRQNKQHRDELHSHG